MCGLKNYNLEEEIENVIKLKELYIRARESLPALIMESPLKSEEIQKLDSLLEKSIKVCDKTLYSKDLCEGLFIDFRFSMDIILGGMDNQKFSFIISFIWNPFI